MVRKARGLRRGKTLARLWVAFLSRRQAPSYQERGTGRDSSLLRYFSIAQLVWLCCMLLGGVGALDLTRAEAFDPASIQAAASTAKEVAEKAKAIG